MASERLFLALPLSDPVRERLREEVVPSDLPGRVVPARNWHVTLRFLGSVPSERAAALTAALQDGWLGSPFSVTLGGIGAFPSAGRARVLWTAVRDDEDSSLESLVTAVDAVLEGHGEPARDRPFHPHLTLSRLRSPTDVRELVRPSGGGGVFLPVDALVLYRSQPGDGPPHYEERVRIGLPGEPRP